MGGIYWFLRMKLVHLVLNGLKGSNCDGMGKQIRGGNEGIFEFLSLEDLGLEVPWGKN